MYLKCKHIYLMAKLVAIFIIIYIIPFTSVIILMVNRLLTIQTGVSTLIALALAYLTGFQVELALRNSALRELEVQPLLRVKLKEGHISGEGEVREVVLRNEGKYPAKMVTIGIVTEPQIDIGKYRRETLKDMLIPGEEVTVMDYHRSLKDYEIRINVMYIDVMEKDRFVMFVKFKGYELFAPIGTPVNLERGVLIKALENLALIKHYLKLRDIKDMSKSRVSD